MMLGGSIVQTFFGCSLRGVDIPGIGTGVSDGILFLVGVDTPGIGTGVGDKILCLVGVLGVEEASSALRRSDMDW